MDTPITGCGCGIPLGQLGGENVYYTGPNLPHVGIITNETLNSIVQKMSNIALSAYTNEQAQDAVGLILTSSPSIVFTYNDITPPSISASVVDSYILSLVNASPSNSYIQNQTAVVQVASARIGGNITAGSLTASLSSITLASRATDPVGANGAIVYRSDLNKMRVNIAGIWQNVATENNIPAPVNAILNQNAVLQTANFRINGIGQAAAISIDGNVGTPLSIKRITNSGQPVVEIFNGTGPLVTRISDVGIITTAGGILTGSATLLPIFGLETSGNTGGPIPATATGIALGWNRSSGGGEGNIVWASNAGSSRHLEFAFSDGTAITTQATLTNTGVFNAVGGLSERGFQAGNIAGKTIYVDNTSSKATDVRTGLNKYSQSFPFVTATAAATTASVGDTILFLGGTYTENITLGSNNDINHFIFTNHTVFNGTILQGAALTAVYITLLNYSTINGKLGQPGNMNGFWHINGDMTGTLTTVDVDIFSNALSIRGLDTINLGTGKLAAYANFRVSNCNVFTGGITSYYGNAVIENIREVNWKGEAPSNTYTFMVVRNVARFVDFTATNVEQYLNAENTYFEFTTAPTISLWRFSFKNCMFKAPSGIVFPNHNPFNFLIENCDFEFTAAVTEAVTFQGIQAGDSIVVRNCTANSTLIIAPNANVFESNSFTHPTFKIHNNFPINPPSTQLLLFLVLTFGLILVAAQETEIRQLVEAGATIPDLEAYLASIGHVVDLSGFTF